MLIITHIFIFRVKCCLMLLIFQILGDSPDFADVQTIKRIITFLSASISDLIKRLVIYVILSDFSDFSNFKGLSILIRIVALDLQPYMKSPQEIPQSPTGNPTESRRCSQNPTDSQMWEFPFPSHMGICGVSHGNSHRFPFPRQP